MMSPRTKIYQTLEETLIIMNIQVYLSFYFQKLKKKIVLEIAFVESV